ncbi:MAG: cupredoxin domain-containing protein [Anaerolineales bacterium]
MIKRLLPLTCLGIVGIAVLAACGGSSAPASAPVERTIYMAAVEPKGGTTVDKEPFPSAALPAGDGYKLVPPNADSRWEVSTYRWEPGTIVVNQGDIVTLEIVGINGANHPFVIEGYNVSGAIKRGEVTRVTFTADKAGIFRITCGIHLPTMTADLVVLANQ